MDQETILQFWQVQLIVVEEQDRLDKAGCLVVESKDGLKDPS